MEQVGALSNRPYRMQKTIRHGGWPILIPAGTVGNTHAECLLGANICYSLNTSKTFFFASLAEIKDFEKDVML
jgi:hypothetical protein